MSCGCEKYNNAEIETLLKAMFTEFATVDTIRVNIFIDIAKLNVNCNAFCSQAKYALVYMTGYLLNIADTSGDLPAGPVTSEKVGDLTRSYSSSGNTSKGNHQENKYGRLYDQLKQSVFVGGVAVTNIITRTGY